MEDPPAEGPPVHLSPPAALVLFEIRRRRFPGLAPLAGQHLND